MERIPAIFCILVAAAGWYYLFYSRAAHKLLGLEDPRANRLRHRLRRIGAGAMILLGIAFAVGYYGVDVHRPTAGFVIAWVLVLILMAVILVVGLADLWLTRRIRRAQKR